MKKTQLILSTLVSTLIIVGSVRAVSVLPGQQGGTGISTTTVSNVGSCLKVVSVSPLTWNIGACGSGGATGTATTTIAGITSSEFILVSTSSIGISTTSPNIINIGPDRLYYLASNPNGFITATSTQFDLYYLASNPNQFITATSTKFDLYVPYTGATGNVDLGGFILAVDALSAGGATNHLIELNNIKLLDSSQVDSLAWNTRTLNNSLGNPNLNWSASALDFIGDFPTFNGSAITTSNISEGVNLYYLDSRARAVLSAGTGIDYDNTTGIISNKISSSSILSLSTSSWIGVSSTAGNYNFIFLNPLSYISSTFADAPLSGLGTSGSHLVFTNPGYITATSTAFDALLRSSSSSINGARGPFTFSTTSDTNLGLGISTSTGVVTFPPFWIGTLADSRITSAGTWNLRTSTATSTLNGLNSGTYKITPGAGLSVTTSTAPDTVALTPSQYTTTTITCSSGLNCSGSTGAVTITASAYATTTVISGSNTNITQSGQAYTVNVTSTPSFTSSTITTGLTVLGSSTVAESMSIGTSTLQTGAMLTIASTSGASLFNFMGNGKLGIGTLPGSTNWLDILTNENANSLLQIKNADATDTGSAAVIRVTADTALNQFIAHGSGRTVSRYGITLGGWSEFAPSAGNGLIVGTINSAPLVFGTNGTVNTSEAMRITTDNKIGIGTTTPKTALHYENASTTFYMSTTAASKGVTLIMEDTDGAGCTGVTALNGVLTATIVACPGS